jgi:hypothetical protein
VVVGAAAAAPKAAAAATPERIRNRIGMPIGLRMPRS